MLLQRKYIVKTKPEAYRPSRSADQVSKGFAKA